MVAGAVATIAAVFLDRLLGEPRRFHPLAGFGRVGEGVEAMLNKGGRCRLRGTAAWALLVIPATALAAVAARLGGVLAEVVFLYLALGGRSLAEHGRAVATALAEGDLNRGRASVGRMVSRDTAEMNENEISRATVESVLENGSDAVFGALFWFLVAGGPGVVLYRLANTLDAMWGYRTERYRRFGWFAARMDDLLNLVPARLTALTYALLGETGTALGCWRSQAGAWESPNAGPVMAAGAGALGLRLGGDCRYHGALRRRPVLGKGREPAGRDIERALHLVSRGALLWAAAAVVTAGGLYIV